MFKLGVLPTRFFLATAPGLKELPTLPLLEQSKLGEALCYSEAVCLPVKKKPGGSHQK